MDVNKYILVSPFLCLTKNNKISNYLNFYSSEGTLVDIDEKELVILKYCKNRVLLKNLCEIYEIKTINDLLEKKLLLYEEELWTTTNIEYLEIETSTHCNHRCIYCPVSLKPKKPETMKMELFNDIIDKAENYRKIKAVTFNSYNEPTIDKYFCDRILRLAQTNIKLILYTNASNLDEDKISLLAKNNVLQILCINLPSLDEETFNYMTGSLNFNKVVKNIDTAIEYGLPVKFSIQGSKEELNNNLPLIKKKYENIILQSDDYGESDDRAGALTNQYAKNINIENEFLYGLCPETLNWLYISVNGDVFICNNDYFQNITYGNSSDYTMDDLVNNRKLQDLRKMIFGATQPPNDFLCRKCDHMRVSKMIYRFSKSIKGNIQK